MLDTKQKLLIAFADLAIPVSRDQLSKAADVSKTRVGPHLLAFVRKGWIRKVDYGIYQITEEGKRMAGKFRGIQLAEPAKLSDFVEVKHVQASEFTGPEYEFMIEYSQDIRAKLRGHFGEKKYNMAVGLLKKLL